VQSLQPDKGSASDTRPRARHARHDRQSAAIPRSGFVTLSNQEREKPPSRVISRDRNGRTPRAHRRGPKGSVGMGGCEVALDVEDVVDDGMR
jgi:hypothetical protein